MKEFKCRASAAGKLMTNPRNKSESLSETTKTFIQGVDERTVIRDTQGDNYKTNG